MILAGVQFAVGTAIAQPPIVLRDLTLIRSNPVASFDSRGVVLADGRSLGWDQVLQASVQEDQQPKFDRFVREFGLPLFRLKTRIANGDWIAAGEIAEPLYQATVRSGEETALDDSAYFTCLATMKFRLRQGDVGSALIPFIRAAMLQANATKSELEIASTGQIPRRDAETKLSSEILPIWFDESPLLELEKELNLLLQSNSESLTNSPGVTIYLASIKIELGKTDEAMRLLRALDSTDPEIASWRTVLEARIHQKTRNPLNAQTMLEINGKSIAGLARPVALYYRGINVLEQKDVSDLDRTKAILTLLRIPAIYGDVHQELAAAALFQSAKITKLRGRDLDAQKLTNELLRRYPRTYHGALELTDLKVVN